MTVSDAPPTTSRMPPALVGVVRPEVWDGFPAFTAQFEGVVHTMYQDVKGFVTTGIGNLIDPVGPALPLPWLHVDGSAATEAEIRAEWQRVKAMPPALVAARYVVPGALRLSDAGIDELVHQHLAGDITQLAHSFPDFPSYPAPVQMALCSIAWAVGSGFASKWPSFTAAIKARDWATAATNGSIKSEGNPGVIPRNKANADLLRSAVGIA